MHKEGNEPCFIYTILYGCYHVFESVLYVRAYYFTVRVTKHHVKKNSS